METGMCGLGPDGFWPGALQRDRQGMLTMHGCPMEDLAKRYGTPMYLMDTAMMAERASAFRQAALRDLGGATTRSATRARPSSARRPCGSCCARGWISTPVPWARC